ncbi:phage-related DNA transposition protein [Tepidicaulis marinus]|uniref:Phage-related DNA transposition protein n=1 Tax=Tepidicaulis marinus TaxID=1333998 RepID=A0A081B6F9_9HYPH|nr:hypothetical protein [Tepidicaulis marinus]GAK43627.1 phage-related DNA transposition protein [Tepidicaulis marinus]
MARVRGDKKTLDLLTWRPEAPKVDRFDPVTVRAGTIGARVSKAVSQVLNDAKAREENPLDRDEIAEKMTEFLGLGEDDKVSAHILNAYASGAREAHNISVVRAVALAHATSDFRLLNLLAEELDLCVIPRRYENAVREAILAEQIENMNDELKALRRGRKS